MRLLQSERTYLAEDRAIEIADRLNAEESENEPNPADRFAYVVCGVTPGRYYIEARDPDGYVHGSL